MIPFNHLGPLFKWLGPSIYPREAVALLCEALQTLPLQADVLDLGAGTGVLSGFAHTCRNDLRYVALDPAEGMLRFAPHFAETHIARAEALPFGAASFEAVLIGEALHHFDDPPKAMEEAARILKPGGLLYLYDFDPETLMGSTVCRAEKILGEPGNFFTPDALKSLLEPHGFRVRIVRFGWRYCIFASLRAPTKNAPLSPA